MKQMMHYIILLLLAVLALFVSGDDVISFQEDNKPTTDSRVTLLFNQAEDALTDFSVCLWFLVGYFRSSSYAFSYATSQERNNELGFYISPTRITTVVRGKYMQGSTSTKIVPNHWYHACVVSTRRSTTLYLNGKFDRVFNFRRAKIPLTGSLVLGQETDDYNGGFQVSQSFSGKITGFNIYNKSLSNNQVEALYNCEEDKHDKILDWSKTKWDEVFNVSVKSINIPEHVCNRRRRFVVMLEQMQFKSAKSLCQKLGSKITVPETSKENTLLYNSVQNLTKKCKPQNHATGFFWIGAQHNGIDWTDTEGNLLNYINVYNGSIDPPAFHTLEAYTWKGAKPFYQFCSACDSGYSTLTLRGICNNRKQDYFFVVDQNTFEETLYFRGYTKYKISYREDRSSWYLSDTWTDTDVASWFSLDKSYPLGLKNWNVLVNHQLCEETKGSQVKLMLSKCNPEDFSCDDGSCVSLKHRCNQQRDCPDGSDEMNCHTLHSLHNYMKHLPPPKTSKNPLYLNASVIVYGLSEVDIQNLMITVDFTLSIMWFESRASFANLKTITDMNTISSDDLWLPEVELVNADFPDINIKTNFVAVEKRSRPEKDDMSRAVHDEIYLGSKNPLIVSRKVNAPFYCNMDLENFPFDTQVCELHIKMTSSHKNIVAFKNVNASYHGETLLTEYRIGSIKVELTELDYYTMAKISIPMTRRYGYYITTAYIPIFLMMFISYSSLFIKYESIDLRVMLTITTLLVLYSLYQQVSAGLPKTSYIKSIDIWSFFSICYIFSLVIFHVAITRENNKIVPDEIKTKSVPTTQRRIIIFGRIFYLIALIVFIVLYFVDIALKIGAI